MTSNYPAYVSNLFTKFIAYRPNQIALLAGMFSFILHLVIWHALQAAAMNSEPASLSQRIEVTLLSDAPKPVSPSMETKPLLSAVVDTEKIQPVAIPLPVSDTVPIAKPIRKISKPSVQEKTKPPLVKHLTSPKATDKTNDTGPGGSAGGYGVASQKGQGTSGSIGLGIGSGTGTGTGTDTGKGSGSGADSDTDTYSEADFKANYATNPKPKYPEVAKSRGWVGNVLLRVRVTADGNSEQVTVHRSSGHNVLDDSAVAAVQKWRFIPARRGSTTVACTVIVPIVFALN